MVFCKNEVSLYNYEKLIGKGYKNNLYEISFKVPNKKCLDVEGNNKEIQLWHKRYGHICQSNLEKLIKQNMVEGIDKNINMCKISFCEPCIAGKMTRQPFSIRRRSNKVMEIIHTDICGPITPAAYDGSGYFITFIDDFSNFTMVYLLKRKSEAFEKFKEYFQLRRTLFGHSIIKLRCDNGGEYISKEFKGFCRRWL